MTTYIVTTKSTGQEVTRYCAAEPVEVLNGTPFPFADFDHRDFLDDTPVVPSTYVWTKLEYLRRFTQAERIAIRDAAKVVPELFDYMELLALAEEIRSDDPDIAAALAMLEGAGLIAAGRAQEILNGR